MQLSLKLKLNLGSLQVLKSIAEENKLLKKLFTSKNPLRNYIVILSTQNRGMLSTLIKSSKHGYFSKNFESYWNNIKNTWKRIKSLITLKAISTSVPKTLNHNNKTLSQIQLKLQIFLITTLFLQLKRQGQNVNYSHKRFSEDMENNSSNSFFHSLFSSPTSINEILSMISNLNPNKSVGPNSIGSYKNHLIFLTSIISL